MKMARYIYNYIYIYILMFQETKLVVASLNAGHSLFVFLSLDHEKQGGSGVRGSRINHIILFTDSIKLYGDHQGKFFSERHPHLNFVKLKKAT